MLFSILALAVSASPPLVAVVGLTPLDVPEKRADYLTEQLGAALVDEGLVVTTPADLRAVLGLERQRQLLGCEGTTCLAELTGALGAEIVMLGQVARSGAGYRLTIKAVKAATGVAMFAWSTEQPTESRLVTELSQAARQFVEALGLAPRRQLALGPLVVGGSGGVIALVGAGFLISAGVAWANLQRRGAEVISVEQAATASREGASHQLIGFTLAGLGVAAAAAGLIWGLVRDAPAKTVLLLLPEGGFVSVQVSW